MPKHRPSILAVSVGVLLAIVLIAYSTGSACTSFAVYGNQTIYGMNFDYANVELRFSIVTRNSRKIFQAFFVENQTLSTICGINSRGLFSSIQMLYPQLSSWPPPGPNEMNLFQAYSFAETQCDSLRQAYNFLQSGAARIVHIPGTTLHDFFADAHSQACVLEVGDDTNHITTMKGRYLVMTNFPNHLFADVPPANVSGVGADRYKTACQFIDAIKEDFAFVDAMELLQATAQLTGNFLTQCSFVFDPMNGHVYLILRREFTRVWKISIDAETIETFSGFDHYTRFSLDSTGISSTTLLATTAVPQGSRGLPGSLFLEQNYPNPFNPSTTITYQLPRDAWATLRILDVLGRQVATPLDQWQSAGIHQVPFRGDMLASGTYFYRLEAAGIAVTKALSIVK